MTITGVPAGSRSPVAAVVESAAARRASSSLIRSAPARPTRVTVSRRARRWRSSSAPARAADSASRAPAVRAQGAARRPARPAGGTCSTYQRSMKAAPSRAGHAGPSPGSRCSKPREPRAGGSLTRRRDAERSPAATARADSQDFGARGVGRAHPVALGQATHRARALVAGPTPGRETRCPPRWRGADRRRRPEPAARRAGSARRSWSSSARSTMDASSTTTACMGQGVVLVVPDLAAGADARRGA